MPAAASPLRLLLVAPEPERSGLRVLLDPARWDTVEADTLRQARFLLQMCDCDVVAVAASLAGSAWDEELTWLAGEASSPLVLLGSAEPDRVAEALHQGALWLPYDHRPHPQLLAAMLAQGTRASEQRRQAAADRAALQDSQGRIDRLLALLWEAAPGEGPVRWYTQRYMLERLDEEVARAQRQGGALSVVLGEMRPATGERLQPGQAHCIASWIADRIGRGKRRSDVAGQYGLHGFMLVLPQCSAGQAEAACRRLRTLLASPPHDDLPPTQACFGLASVPADRPSVQGLLRCAEERLQQGDDANSGRQCEGA
jgi:GGDEF domain-containing protein